MQSSTRGKNQPKGQSHCTSLSLSTIAKDHRVNTYQACYFRKTMALGCFGKKGSSLLEPPSKMDKMFNTLLDALLLHKEVAAVKKK